MWHCWETRHSVRCPCLCSWPRGLRGLSLPCRGTAKHRPLPHGWLQVDRPSLTQDLAATAAPPKGEGGCKGSLGHRGSLTQGQEAESGHEGRKKARATAPVQHRTTTGEKLSSE